MKLMKHELSSQSTKLYGKTLRPKSPTLLGGSGDLVSKVISPLIGVISNYKYSYLSYNPSY